MVPDPMVASSIETLPIVPWLISTSVKVHPFVTNSSLVSLKIVPGSTAPPLSVEKSAIILPSAYSVIPPYQSIL